MENNIEPKVIDLSGNSQPPKVGGFFHRKAFIFGILGVVILAVVGIGVGLFALRQQVGIFPRAADCISFQKTNKVGGRGPKASISGKAVNSCNQTRTIYFYKFWCSDVRKNLPGQCLKNGSAISFDVPAKSQMNVSGEQLVGNNGTCGSAQVDVGFHPFDPANPDPNGVAGVKAYLDPCAPPTPFTFKTCESNACVPKDCVPPTTDCSKDSTCTSDSDCAPKTHLECVSEACKPVSGAGDDKCKVDGDCVPATHKECRSNSCQTVSGAGQSSCNMDSDCAPAQPQTHKECRNNACVAVSGAGSDGCNMDSDCVAAPVTHKTCQNNSCVTVSGAGTDSCMSDASCRPAATPPPIPKSGNELFTIAGLILGAGSLLVGLLLIL